MITSICFFLNIYSATAYCRYNNNNINQATLIVEVPLKTIRNNKILWKDSKLKSMKTDVIKKTRIKTQALLLLVASIFIPVLINAQEEFPPPPDLGDGQVYDVPLDDNIYLLLIVAVIYGIFMIWSDKKACSE